MQTKCPDVIAVSKYDSGVLILVYFLPIFLLLVAFYLPWRLAIQLLQLCCLSHQSFKKINNQKIKSHFSSCFLNLPVTARLHLSGALGVPAMDPTSLLSSFPTLSSARRSTVQAVDMLADCLFKLRKDPSPPLSGLGLPNMVRYVLGLHCFAEIPGKVDQENGTKQVNFLLADKKGKSFHLDSIIGSCSSSTLLLLAPGPIWGIRMQEFCPGFTLDYLLIAQMQCDVGGKPSGPHPR